MVKISALVFLALLCLPAILCGESIREPRTGVEFPKTIERNGTTFQLVGVGLRSKFMVKVYAGALYLDSSASQKLEAFRSEAAHPSQRVCDAIIRGQFQKLFVLHFVRDVGYDRIQGAFKEGLELTMDINARDVKADVESFLRSFKKDVAKGEELELLVEEHQVSVISPSGDVTVIKNPKIAMGTTACWLGSNAVQPDLKKGLVSRLSAIFP